MLARGLPPPGRFHRKLNNRGGRACRARAQHKRARVLHLRRPGGSSPQPDTPPLDSDQYGIFGEATEVCSPPSLGPLALELPDLGRPRQCHRCVVPLITLAFSAGAKLPGGGLSETVVNASLAFIENAKPKDEVESALLIQMACTHTAAMSVLGTFAGSHNHH